jgi:hypothetical protein
MLTTPSSPASGRARLAPLELAELARELLAIGRVELRHRLGDRTQVLDVGAERCERVACEVQRIVDLVGHARRQLAHRREPLRLDELDLGLLQLRERALELAVRALEGELRPARSTAAAPRGPAR